MTDVQKLLAETVCAVLSDHASSDTAMRAMDEGLWARLEEAGLTGVSVPEHLGGSGGSLTDAAIVASAVAEAGARVPLVETALEAGWLLQEAELELPPGPLTAAYVPSGFGRRSKTIDLSVERVPWGRASRHLVIASEAGGADVVTYVSTRDAVISHGANLAGEPRDRLLVSAHSRDDLMRPVPSGTARLLRFRQALTRSVMLAAAAQRALRATVGYANEREQFGRPIGKFQAVQHLIAEMAGEVAIMTSAAGAAIATCESAGMSARQTRFAIAAAKAQCSQSATTVARIAHQVHGAIGFTHESALRHMTTRLWAWRDEAGNERSWFAAAERELRDSNLDVWQLVTE